MAIFDRIKKNGLSLGVAALLAGSLCAKFSYIVGSWSSHFSGAAFLVPLSGAFGGVWGSLIAAVIRIALGGSLFGSLCLFSYWVPGLVASFYWSRPSSRIWAVVPLVCLVLFVVHPVGAQAWGYSLYWLIPVALLFSSRLTIFTRSLTSTFIAHAVGSVIWLYARPMTPAVWWALIPIVAFERLAYAGGMTVAYHAFDAVRSKMSSLVHALSLSVKGIYS